jgi:hypothetical protein
VRHEVRRGADGREYCTCPAWIYQHSPKGQRLPCWHVQDWRKRAGRAEERRQKRAQLSMFESAQPTEPSSR